MGLFLLLFGFSSFCWLMFGKLSGYDFSFCVVVSVDLLSVFLMEVNFPLVFDCISLSFSAVVCFISAWVVVYSGFYMSHETYLRRFLFLVFLFVVAMNLLIFSPSMLTLMVGWDGLGVISFLLVVYYMDYNSYSAGVITVLSNRIGDVLFIIFLSLACRDLSFDYFMVNFYSSGLLMGLGACILIGSITKSAQIPFSAWLPAAMAAPTPVSTLVHSSTLVTAGVFVIIRFSDLLGGGLKVALILLALCTFYLAGVSGVFEVDMKKVVALSTLSQVSMMMLALGLGLKFLALYHLLVHAFFKALMFMCVGSMMFMSGGSQDIRFFSGVLKKAPLSSTWFFISVVCLCGLPFMSGFYSKDIIVEFCLSSSWGIVMSLMILGSVAMTAGYAFRVLFLLFKDIEIFGFGLFVEEDQYLVSALWGLGVGALFSGYFLQCVLRDSVNYFNLPGFWKVMVLGFLVIGVSMSVCLVYSSAEGVGFLSLSNSVGLARFVGKMMFLPLLSGVWLGSSVLKLGTNWVNYVESFWLSKAFWYSGFSDVFGFYSSKVRDSNAKYVGVGLVGGLIFVWLVFVGFGFNW
uniref:NADH-ubiquinone oxidoreductase chain 5 n=1 Tax=Lutraria maxima TaxID=971267 RepID=A0A343S4N8_9BIVA|nr:NADH dehydrogenase subunit 5 [Lutraria maxima]AUH21204.1 NADH dehydrogenase subunit 5 [Lutraria maxima]